MNYRADGGESQRIATGHSATTHTGTVTTTGNYTVSVQSTNGGMGSQWRNTDVAGWLTASGVSASGATLTIANHSGDWYVKQTAPTAGTCSASAITGTTTHALTLSAAQTYTYAAYSDSSCATEIGSATFSTPITLTVSNITTTGATLTIAGHSGDWHYKADNAPDNTCSSSAVTGATKTLTGLTSGTSYTYSAYSDSNCATLLATAAAFYAVALTASEITATTATLTIAGHSGNWHYKADTGPDASCSSSAVSGTTESLTGLTGGTSYTYSAYNDSSCATLLATAAMFTTPTLTVTNVQARSATLNITDHTAQWWYKADTGPDNTCQGPVAANDSTDDLTSLDPGTAYVYTAYSDSGCSTTLATASSFTTEISLDVYHVTEHAATLRLHGWNAQWWFKRTAGTPVDNTCEGPIASGSDGSTGGMQHSNQYTVKAYSASGCNDADEIAERVFNTPARN